jgi:hypothetical protein
MFCKHIVKMYDVVVNWVVLLLHIQEVLVSYLSTKTSSPKAVCGFH